MTYFSDPVSQHLRVVKDKGMSKSYTEIKICLQHLLLDGKRRCLSEVDNPRLILTDVMNQHNSPTKPQPGTKQS